VAAFSELTWLFDIHIVYIHEEYMGGPFMSKDNKSRYALLGMLNKFTKQSSPRGFGSGSKEHDGMNLAAAPSRDFDEKHHPQVSRSPGVNLRGILFSLALNVAIPLLLYNVCKNNYHTSDVVALSIAAIFPICDSIFEVVLHRQLDLIALLSVLGAVTSIVGVLLGGDAKLLLIRESFFTAALGLACFISFLLPRPLMFYFGRQMMAGKDAAKLAAFNGQWKLPRIRFAHRLITFVWGCAFLGEFLVRIVLVLTLPPVLVLAFAPIITNGIVVGMILWTFAYVRNVRRKLEAQMDKRAM
jgi:hypothetical protein